MKYSINKIIAAAMALIMNISYIPGVEAEDIFHIIKNEDDVRKLTETLDSLTESDIQSLGIDTGIYKLIKERDYVSERIIEKGFDTVEEFRDAFNEAVDTLTYTVSFVYCGGIQKFLQKRQFEILVWIKCPRGKNGLKPICFERRI